MQQFATDIQYNIFTIHALIHIILHTIYITVTVATKQLVATVINSIGTIVGSISSWPRKYVSIVSVLPIILQLFFLAYLIFFLKDANSFLYSNR